MKSGDFIVAKERYEAAISLLEPHKETVFKSVDVGEGAKEAQALMISLYSNLAMVTLKLGDFKACVQNCTLVLSKDPANIKALFRRGCARHKEGKLEEAKDDLEKLLQMEPENAAGKKELILLNKSMKVLKFMSRYCYSI